MHIESSGLCLCATNKLIQRVCQGISLAGRGILTRAGLCQTAQIWKQSAHDQKSDGGRSFQRGKLGRSHSKVGSVGTQQSRRERKQAGSNQPHCRSHFVDEPSMSSGRTHNRMCPILENYTKGLVQLSGVIPKCGTHPHNGK